MANTKKSTARKTPTMSKAELVAKVSRDTNYSQREISEMLNAVIDEIGYQLSQGTNVVIMDFGAFKVQDVNARKGRNLHTGETVVIPAHSRVKFTPGKKLSGMIKSTK